MNTTSFFSLFNSSLKSSLNFSLNISSMNNSHFDVSMKYLENSTKNSSKKLVKLFNIFLSKLFRIYSSICFCSTKGPLCSWQ